MPACLLAVAPVACKEWVKGSPLGAGRSWAIRGSPRITMRECEMGKIRTNAVTIGASIGGQPRRARAAGRFPIPPDCMR